MTLPGSATPRRFDVCNGDADGLCAVRQWRLHEPAAATLVTGLKREITLLQRVPADLADEVLVCAAFGGSGRAAAAGIDGLPASELERFIQAFAAAHWE